MGEDQWGRGVIQISILFNEEGYKHFANFDQNTGLLQSGNGHIYHLDRCGHGNRYQLVVLFTSPPSPFSHHCLALAVLSMFVISTNHINHIFPSLCHVPFQTNILAGLKHVTVIHNLALFYFFTRFELTAGSAERLFRK